MSDGQGQRRSNPLPPPTQKEKQVFREILGREGVRLWQEWIRKDKAVEILREILATKNEDNGWFTPEDRERMESALKDREAAHDALQAYLKEHDVIIGI